MKIKFRIIPIIKNIMELSCEQEAVFNNFKQKENIFMTGPGGSGKSFLIKLIYDWCKENNKDAQVCALTGCAAILLQCRAKTVHSWAGIGMASGEAIDIIFWRFLSITSRR